jgi:hypothetical protein
MKGQDRQEALRRFHLTEEKAYQMIERAMRACIDYSTGKLTMDQVWHRVRGDRFLLAAQIYPDDDLGAMLYELSMSFFTDRETFPDVLHRSILEIADKIQKNQGLTH